MGCFIVPAAEAVVTTVAQKAGKKKDHRVKWLSNMLWGGTALLTFEHLWHGEIEPFFPFLTAARNPEELRVVFHEMATTGVAMTVAVTLVWCGMLIVSNVLEKKKGLIPCGETVEVKRRG